MPTALQSTTDATASAPARAACSQATLAILAPRWGAPSETFVRRHLTEIAPGTTIGVTRKVIESNWCPEVPVLSVREIPDLPTDRLARMFGQWRLDRRGRALRNFLGKHRAGVVMGEWLNFSCLWFQTVRTLGVKFFAHSHGDDATVRVMGNRWRQFLYRHLRQMDGVITVSDLTKQRLVNSFGLDASRVHVVPCGVDVPEKLTRQQTAGRVVCLHVGRMVEKKAPLATLKAFHLAHQQRGDLRMEFIGDGPLLSVCENYGREHGLGHVVTFHGSKSHAFVKQRLASADILLLHSVTASNGDEEGLPVAILEGMAHGLPVVSTLHAGIPEAVLDGQTGFLVPEHDFQAMAGRIGELAGKPDLRRGMGLAGHNRARDHFSAGQEIRRLREILFNND